jgi:hypothetical protein
MRTGRTARIKNLHLRTARHQIAGHGQTGNSGPYDRP